jgi:hypothetical protein
VSSEKWGKSVVEQLSKDLQTEFPGIRGFSARNIDTTGGRNRMGAKLIDYRKM